MEVEKEEKGQQQAEYKELKQEEEKEGEDSSG